jgi:4-diphosphocytidyl-2-C-methyl-D-erythritol kinase
MTPHARTLVSRAPAKVNLTLHIVGRRADGFHELESLVCFAGCGDTLSLTPHAALALAIEGPFAQGLGEADNLVLKAARAFEARRPGLATGAFRLAKRLPIASGIGGGSSDAAAALRLLADANAIAPDDPALIETARAIGADVSVCLEGRARVMRGLGERLGAPLSLPPLFCVLVNPGLAVPTGAVFAELGLAPGAATAGAAHPDVHDGLSFEHLIGKLRGARNDLEAPARRVAPVIGEVIGSIAAAQDCVLARMSGSGATCFGLFATCRAAARAARALRRARPAWWVKATVLR